MYYLYWASRLQVELTEDRRGMYTQAFHADWHAEQQALAAGTGPGSMMSMAGAGAGAGMAAYQVHLHRPKILTYSVSFYVAMRSGRVRVLAQAGSGSP